MYLIHRKLAEVCWPVLQKTKHSLHNNPTSEVAEWQAKLKDVSTRLESGSLSAEQHNKLSQRYMSMERQLAKLQAKVHVGLAYQGPVFVPFKHVPVCNQKHVSGSSRKCIVYNKVKYGCFHTFF